MLLSAFPAMFGMFVKYQFQRTTTRSSQRLSTPRSSLRRRRLDWYAGGVYSYAPLIVAIPFGLDPSWGMPGGAVDLLHLRLRRPASAIPRSPASPSRSTTSATSSARCSSRPSSSLVRLSDPRAPGAGRSSREPQPASPLRRARAARRVRLGGGGATSPASPSSPSSARRRGGSRSRR